jgi:hypothetical protein
MANENRPKTLYYKRAEFFSHDAELMKVLQAAMKKHTTAKSRFQRLGTDKKGARLLNHFESIGTAVCGTLIEFTEGNLQPIVELAEDATELPVSMLGAPGDRTQFIEGTLFFLVSGNHVILATSKSVRSGQAEQYLDWLLREQAKLVPSHSRVLLQEHVKSDSRRRFNNVKSVRITPDYVNTDGAAPVTPEVREHFKLRGTLLHAVVEMLKTSSNRALPKDLDINTALAERRLRATVEVSYNGKMPEDGVPLLDSLAAALRHADDVEYTVDVKGVGQVKSGELRLQQEVIVPFSDGLPVPARLYVAMHEWLTQLLTSGEIKPAE